MYRQRTQLYLSGNLASSADYAAEARWSCRRHLRGKIAAGAPPPYSRTLGPPRIDTSADDGGGDDDAVLAKIANVGIDVDALAAQFRDDEANSFLTLRNDLRFCIGSKGAGSLYRELADDRCTFAHAFRLAGA